MTATQETLSRAIAAYEHAAAEAERRAETHEALASRDPGHALAARSLRSMSEAMRQCASALKPKDLTAAIKEALEND